MAPVFGVHDLWLFVLSALLLNVTPGPDTLDIVGRSASQGLRAGALAALGIGAGALVHVSAAALGLFNGTIWNLFVAWSASRLSRRAPGAAQRRVRPSDMLKFRPRSRV